VVLFPFLELAFGLTTVTTINFEDHTSHLASRLSSMERDAKAAMVNGGTGRMTPLWKKHMANKKLVTTTILNFQIVFFAEPFFNVHSFWGWRIFESIKCYIEFLFSFVVDL